MTTFTEKFVGNTETRERETSVATAALVALRVLLGWVMFQGGIVKLLDPEWTAAGFLIVWLSWVDDCVCFGQPDDVKESMNELNELFECDDVAEFEEYVGCKIERSKESLKMTQKLSLKVEGLYMK